MTDNPFWKAQLASPEPLTRESFAEFLRSFALSKGHDNRPVVVSRALYDRCAIMPEHKGD
jgi:hypothetical protein